jgi:hypothetical protein
MRYVRGLFLGLVWENLHLDPNLQVPLAMTQSIRQDIQQWQAEAQEQRLRLLERAPAQEIDPWHQYTGWETILRRSKHDLTTTAEYARQPDADETVLSRLITAWGLIVERAWIRWRRQTRRMCSSGGHRQRMKLVASDHLSCRRVLIPSSSTAKYGSASSATSCVRRLLVQVS